MLKSSDLRKMDKDTIVRMYMQNVESSQIIKVINDTKSLD